LRLDGAVLVSLTDSALSSGLVGAFLGANSVIDDFFAELRGL
jgi:hypothetical protein